MSDVSTDGVVVPLALAVRVCVMVSVCVSPWALLPKCLVPCCVRPVCLSPTRLPLVRLRVTACPRSGIVLVLLLHCDQLASSGFGVLSLSFSFSLYPPAVFFFFKATCPFAFHLLIHERLMVS